MKPKILKVKTISKNYNIYVGNDILRNLKSILFKEKLKFNKVLIIKDREIDSKYFNTLKTSLKKKKVLLFNFHSCEKNKNLNYVNKLISYLLKNNFSREDVIISMGGGILGDLACFASSIYKRGMKFINIPTTLLAQVDASIGGKSGVNQKQFGKNLIGTFYQPDLVLSDTKFLRTLSKKQILCGYAEILKHSLIFNLSFFNFLDKNLNDILSLKKPFIEKAIIKSCKIKKQIVQKDEKEKNLRKLLNLGHTFGHAYEASQGFKGKLAHGEAVILGIESSINFSLKERLLRLKEYEKIKLHLNKLGLKFKFKDLFKKKDIENLLNYMRNDKKNKTEKINLILLKKIGYASINNYYNVEKLRNFFYKELFN